AALVDRRQRRREPAVEAGLRGERLLQVRGAAQRALPRRAGRLDHRRGPAPAMGLQRNGSTGLPARAAAVATSPPDGTPPGPAPPRVGGNSGPLPRHNGRAAGPDAAAPPVPTREQEEQELSHLLALPEIARSANLVRLLSFICEKYFEGKADEIRESAIA